MILTDKLTEEQVLQISLMVDGDVIYTQIDNNLYMIECSVHTSKSSPCAICDLAHTNCFFVGDSICDMQSINMYYYTVTIA